MTMATKPFLPEDKRALIAFIKTPRGACYLNPID
jgi:hypothetical protein